MAAFNVYYICRAGHANWPCRTVTLSKWWKKKHEDPLATKQKWYCPKCQAGYKTKWGVIIEMVVNRKVFDIPAAEGDEDNFEIAKGIMSKEWIGLYCKAELPPQHLQDMNAQCVERFNPECTTPTQLLDAIPCLRPISKRALISRPGEGVYDLTEEADNMMDSVNWDELLSIDSQLTADEPPAAASSTGT